MQKDPIGLAAGDANQYRYVANRPIDSVAPSGLLVINRLGVSLPQKLLNSTYYKILASSESNHIFLNNSSLTTNKEIQQYQAGGIGSFIYGETTLFGAYSSLNHISVDINAHKVTNEKLSDTLNHEFGHVFFQQLS